MGHWVALLILLAPTVSTAQDDCRELVKSGAEAKARDCYLAFARGGATGDAKADALYQAGRSQSALGEVREALVTYGEVLELRRATGNRKGEGVVLNDIANAYWSLGEFITAERRFQEALAFREGLHDAFGAALCRFGIGHIYTAWGDTEQALALYGGALKGFREMKNERFEAEALNAMGLAYAGIGEHGKAVAQYKDALVLWRKLGLKAREAYTLNNLGLLELDRHAPQAALDFFGRALPSLEEARDLRAQAYVLANQGQAEAALRHFDRSLPLFERSLALKRRIGDQAGEADTLECMGEALAASGDPTSALAKLDQALALHRQVGTRPGEAVALAERARVLRAQNRLAESRRDIEAALTLIEDLRTQLTDRDLRTTYFSSRQDYFAFYIDLLMALHDDRAAVEAAERSRARVLLELLHDARVDPREGVPPELLARKRDAERQLRALAQRPNSSARMEESLRAWNEADAAIRKASPRYAALVSPSPLTVVQIQGGVLDQGTVLVEYALGAQRSYAWLVTPTGVKGATLPPGARIEALVRSALAALAKHADGEFEIAARKLGGVLLGPFAADVASKRLLIVPDGALHYVPFAALRLPGQNRQLLATNEIVRAPSASIVAALRTEPRGNTTRGAVVAVADPVFESADPRVLGEASVAAGSGEQFEYTRLRFSREEVSAITSLVPDRTRVLLDFDANRETVLGGSLAGYRIVHFATHAEIDNEHPALSRIVLSGVDRRGRRRDGAIRLFEIFNLKLDADLVVVSACRSALGKDIRGEGLVGLARGFFQAGARGVVASLWDVEDRATAVLMRRFYERMLRGGQSPAAALRQAQLALASDERWKSPYYWASFTLQGDWR